MDPQESKYPGASISATNVSIIKAYLDHLMDAAKSIRRLGHRDVADKIQMAAEQIDYYFDPRFAEHREDTDRWIERLKKARDANFSRMEAANGNS